MIGNFGKMVGFRRYWVFRGLVIFFSFDFSDNQTRDQSYSVCTVYASLWFNQSHISMTLVQVGIGPAPIGELFG